MRESPFLVMVEQGRAGRHVAHQDPFSDLPGLRRVRVEADLDALEIMFREVVIEILPVDPDVAGDAVGVGLAVADLALHLAAVQFVLPDAVVFVWVAVRTLPRLGQVIAGADAFRSAGVHLPGRMAGDAVHAVLLCVHVAHAALAEELVAHPRPVAARALVDGVRTLAEDMAVDEAALGSSRAADVASAAACVACAAMSFPGRVDGTPDVGG